MSGIVLRGDWVKLHRSGNRVWVRERPYEVVWRTTADFTVDDIRSIEIEARGLELNRRRRGRVGGTKVLRPAVTRITIDHGADEPLSIDVKESESTVVAAFADLGDRLVTPPSIDLVAEHAIDAVQADDPDMPYISWRADATESVPPAPVEPAVEVERDREALVATAERLHPDLARDVSFKLELGADPDAVEDWLQRKASAPDDEATSGGEDELFPEDGTTSAGSDAGWVRKRKKRPIHHRVLRRPSDR